MRFAEKKEEQKLKKIQNFRRLVYGLHFIDSVFCYLN